MSRLAVVVAALVCVALSAPVQEAAPSRLLLKSFSFTDCAPASAPIHSYVSIKPDPIVLPGTITAVANLSLNAQLASPIKAEVEIKKGVIKIPCTDNFGSCTYDDICTLLEKIPLGPDGKCPDPLPKYGVPCRCPLTPFAVNVPQTSIPVNTSIPAILDGEYSLKVTLTGSTGTQVGCAELTVEVKSG